MRYRWGIPLLAFCASVVVATPVETRNVVPRATVTTGVPPPPDPTNLPCASGGVLVLVAVGTNVSQTQTLIPTYTDPGYNVLSPALASVVSAATSAGGHKSYYTAIPYPAAPGEGYIVSLRRGIITTKDIIQNYVTKCGPDDSKIVVIGFSQGAQVMSSALGGGDTEEGIGATLAQNIVAGAIFADPSRIYPCAVDAGNATTEGLLTALKTPTQELDFCNMYQGRMQSYCQAGDKYCASGVMKDAQHIHDVEPNTYHGQAINYIVPLIKAATA